MSDVTPAVGDQRVKVPQAECPGHEWLRMLQPNPEALENVQCKFCGTRGWK